MTRYAEMFARLAQQGAGGFVPFVLLGDPNPALSAEILRALVRGGADALELGIPFSDPVADGPTIQAASVRALAAGVRTADCWRLIADFRVEHPEIPIGLLVYANLVEGPGRDAFYAAAAGAGVDSVLVADVPCFEVEPYARSAEAHGIDAVLIAPPNADEDRLRQIAELGRGYTYVVTRAGVTGADESVEPAYRGLLSRLAALGAPPAVLGFGISAPAHVRTALAAGAAAVISGSAIVDRIARHRAEPEVLLREVEEFVRAMKGATGDEH